MKLYLYENKEDNNFNTKLNVFLKNKLNQSNYEIDKIYEDNKKFEYNYIICEDNEEIKAVMPFVLYKNKLANIIHSMPFVGYGGIDSVDEKKEVVFKNVIEFLEKVAKEKDVKLITICTHPFKEEEYKLYKDFFKPDFERKNFYQYIDLSKDVFEKMSTKQKAKLRKNIRKSEKCEVKIIENNDVESLSYWYENVYLKRLRETSCAIYPYSVFETFVTKTNSKMIYGKVDNKIIAGGLFLKQGNHLDNFMRVVDSEFFSTQVGTVIDNYSIQYAIKNKFKYYNWQSCDEIGSSIFKYKEDWSSELGYHYYLTKITGDISELKKTPIKVIKENFEGIYVLPYEEFI